MIGSSGKLYLAAILDLFSRFIVGWAVSAVNDRHLTLKALQMAIKRRCPEAGLLHHSDQGSQYTSERFQTLLAEFGITGLIGDSSATVPMLIGMVGFELMDRFIHAPRKAAFNPH